MILGVGYDLCKISRMERSLQSPAFCSRVFGQEEYAALCRVDGNARLQSAAACFAAKEAFLKAAGVGLGGFALGEIQALRRESGAPYYALLGNAARWLEENGCTLHLSLTHEAGLAGAVAILEKRD